MVSAGTLAQLGVAAGEQLLALDSCLPLARECRDRPGGFGLGPAEPFQGLIVGLAEPAAVKS